MSTRESGSDRMSCCLTGDDAVTQASDAARAFGELQWLGEDELARLSIVIEELIANLYEHGGVSRDQEVRLELASEPQGIRVTIIDPGTPFDPRQPLLRDRPERGGGAGIDIVRAWAQLISYELSMGVAILATLLPVGSFRLAEVVRLRHPDPVAAILDFARSHSVGHIVVGRSHQPWWRQAIGRSVPSRLVQQAAGFDLHIVSLEEDA